MKKLCLFFIVYYAGTLLGSNQSDQRQNITNRYFFVMPVDQELRSMIRPRGNTRVSSEYPFTIIELSESHLMDTGFRTSFERSQGSLPQNYPGMHLAIQRDLRQTFVLQDLNQIPLVLLSWENDSDNQYARRFVRAAQESQSRIIQREMSGNNHSAQ